MHTDYLIIGSGLTGATIARTLHDEGLNVLVLEAKSSVGGNVVDHEHESGIRIHTYGPHYFRTSSEPIWNFVNRFDSFYKYEAKILADINGQLEQWPITRSYIKKTFGGFWSPNFPHGPPPRNLEEACLSLMPRVIYETFIKEYNEKQWARPCTKLSADLCKRFDVREDDEPRLTPKAKHQGLPTHGYSYLMQRMLKDIPVLCNCNYLDCRNEFTYSTLIFTGPIDEFFGCDLGRLEYRSQKRETTFHQKEFHQITAQVNNPLHGGGKHIRTIEWKHLTPDKYFPDTVITTETPYSPRHYADYEYPFPDTRNQQLFLQYKERTENLTDTIIAGRLGEYRYYDMDQAIGRAMQIAEKLKKTCISNDSCL